ncbi:MAG: glycerophosphoryl diester phosphodiesterase [Verrucomicrobiales bacterium]|jgi:glycerophosphoryl diester phosphodiesterase
MKIAIHALSIFLAMTSSLSAQLIVAHRGASHDAPENTLAAFNLAWEKGADAVEGDFLLTSDGQVVCIHDGTAMRTGGQDLKISETTLTDLQKLEYGAWKDPRWKGEPIPTLAEVLKSIPDGKLFFLEVKGGPVIVPALAAEIRKSELKAEQIVIIAFNAQVIAEAKKALPEIKACWLASFKQDKDSGEWTPSAASIIETLKRIGADGVDCRAELAAVDEGFVKEIRAAGMELHCWTVNNPEQARRLQQLGFDSITTDRPAFIRKALESTPE